MQSDFVFVVCFPYILPVLETDEGDHAPLGVMILVCGRSQSHHTVVKQGGYERDREDGWGGKRNPDADAGRWRKTGRRRRSVRGGGSREQRGRYYEETIP